MIAKKLLVVASVTSLFLLGGITNAEAGYVRCHGGCCYHYTSHGNFKYKTCAKHHYYHHKHCDGHINRYGKCCFLGVCEK